MAVRHGGIRQLYGGSKCRDGRVEGQAPPSLPTRARFFPPPALHRKCLSECWQHRIHAAYFQRHAAYTYCHAYARTCIMRLYAKSCAIPVGEGGGEAERLMLLLSAPRYADMLWRRARVLANAAIQVSKERARW